MNAANEIKNVSLSISIVYSTMQTITAKNRTIVRNDSTVSNKRRLISAPT